MTLRAGALRDRVRIERPIHSRHRGETQTTWATAWSGRAELRQTTGRETREAAQTQAVGGWYARIRWQAAIARLGTDCRLVELRTGRILEIAANFDPWGKRRELRLDLVDHSAAGVAGGPQR